ncbi:MAG: pyruvate kinase [Candidatus Methanomethylicia archaeon]
MRVKIIATLGPSTKDIETIREMVIKGASAFRINFSHGSEEEWRKYVKYVRTIERELNVIIGIGGDLKGGSVRIGELREPIKLKMNMELMILNKQKDYEGNIPLPYIEFYDIIEPGDIILMDDGKIMLKVEDVKEDKVKVRSLTPGEITSRKGIVVRGKEFNIPAITEEDLKNIKFAVENSLDYIGLSYVKSGEDVKKLKKILYEAGCEETAVMSKIECVSAVKNLEEIVRESDMILVARGDLGMQFPLERIPVLQREIIEKTRLKGKPVIVATQVLASMIENPTPTRAEVTDVAHAIIEGVDAIMLTGETAIGIYPVEAVEWLKSIIEANEEKINIELKPIDDDLQKRFAYSIVVLAESINSKLAVYTQKGRMAARIAAYRPRVPVYAASNNIRTLRKLSMIWGLKTIKVDAEGYMEGLEATYQALMREGYVKDNETLVLTYGLIEEGEHIIKIKRKI